VTPTGVVFDVSRGCVEDGPGVRTVVFLKGCPNHCGWCHNPEGRSPRPEIALDRRRCLECGACEEACPNEWVADDPESWRRVCTGCGACAEACPSGARRLVGRRVEVDALVAEVMADADFFAGTGGGVTFSGGEPLAQGPFLFACASALRAKGVHVAVETSGTWAASVRKDLRDSVDLVLFDLKHVDPARLRAEVGVGAPRALSNLRALLEADLSVQIRLTVVPGFNDGDEDLAAIADWLADCPGTTTLHLQPFHRMAVAKQVLYDRPYAWADVEPTHTSRLIEAQRWFG